jgi:hypothetical protein
MSFPEERREDRLDVRFAAPKRMAAFPNNDPRIQPVGELLDDSGARARQGTAEDHIRTAAVQSASLRPCGGAVHLSPSTTKRSDMMRQ